MLDATTMMIAEVMVVAKAMTAMMAEVRTEAMTAEVRTVVMTEAMVEAITEG